MPGIFSSQVTANQSNEVLLRGPGCNRSITEEDFAETASTNAKYITKKYLDDLNYALECYRNRQTTQSGCQLYTRSSLSYKITRNATCPFGAQICQRASGNLKMDSGKLDSWEDLGMNAELRFQISLVQHCAPLITSGYKQSYVSPTDPSKSYMRYSYLRDKTIMNNTTRFFASGDSVLQVPLKDPFDTLSQWTTYTSIPDYRTK